MLYKCILDYCFGDYLYEKNKVYDFTKVWNGDYFNDYENNHILKKKKFDVHFIEIKEHRNKMINESIL
jgi:hypothetical protein